MKKLLFLLLFIAVAAAVIVVGILLGNASWYASWIVGTALFVGILAAAVIWSERLDAQRSDRS